MLGLQACPPTWLLLHSIAMSHSAPTQLLPQLSTAREFGQQNSHSTPPLGLPFKTLSSQGWRDGSAVRVHSVLEQNSCQFPGATSGGSQAPVLQLWGWGSNAVFHGHPHSYAHTYPLPTHTHNLKEYNHIFKKIPSWSTAVLRLSPGSGEALKQLVSMQGQWCHTGLHHYTESWHGGC